MNLIKEKDIDAYHLSAFSLKNKLLRVIWKICWTFLCRWTPVPLHKWRCFILRLFGAKIGKTNFIYPNCKVWAPWLLVTEDTVTIGPRVEVYNPGGVFLGHHSILSQDSYLCGATHNYNSASFDYIKKEIIVLPYAWVCARAVVLPGVTLGEGSVLGASSLATRSLESWSVYAGNPATFVKTRTKFV
jgi:putative colanic acid biosynthesis acetyltransferase WcaF